MNFSFFLSLSILKLLIFYSIDTLSPSNLLKNVRRMMKFVLEFTDIEILVPVARHLTRSHSIGEV